MASQSRVPQETVELLLRRFQFGLPDRFFAPLDELNRFLSSDLQRIAEACRANLEAANTVASIPFTLMNTAAVQQRFHSLFSAARIRQLVDQPTSEAEKREADRRAHRIANEKFAEEARSEEGKSWLRDEVLERMADALREPEFDAAASELLRQTLVSVWSAFEVCATDLIRWLLNSDATSSVALLANEQARKHFPVKGISVETLAEYGFDVSRTMGDVLLAERSLDALPVLKDVLSALFPGREILHRKVGDRALWILWQRRHLIVHQRGMIDRRYLQKTGDAAELGVQLQVRASDIDEALILVQGIVVELLSAARARTCYAKGAT